MSRPVIRIIGIALAALALLLSTAPSTSAVTWGGIKPLTTSGEAYSWGSSTAVVGTSGIIVAYREIVGGEYQVYVRKSGDAGASWRPPRLMSTDAATRATRPAIAAQGNNADVVWVEDRSDGTARVLHARTTNAGQDWSAPVPLSTTGRAGFPAVSRANGKVIVAWTNEASGAVYVRVSTNGGASFSERRVIASTGFQPWIGSNDFAIEAFPDIAISNGVIDVAYRTNKREVRLRRSTDQGASWQSTQTLLSNAHREFDLAAGGGEVLIGYSVFSPRGDRYLAVRRSTNQGRTWSAPILLSGRLGHWEGVPILSKRAGLWRVAFARCNSSQCSSQSVVYRQSPDGRAWSTPQLVTGSAFPKAVPVGVNRAGTHSFVVFEPYGGQPTCTSAGRPSLEVLC